MVQDNSGQLMSMFKMAKFTAIYEVGEKGIYLPEYKGSTIRGSFGHIFKQVACTCQTEKHEEDCIYSYVFETSPPKDTVVLRKYESIPRPFVFETIYDPRTYFSPGERLAFSFTLFGKAIEYLPYFVYSLQEMGKQGLGKFKQSMSLRQVFQLNVYRDFEILVYDGNKERIYNAWKPLYGEEILNKVNVNGDKQDLTVHFITPTRIKSKGEYKEVAPDFDELMKSIVRRFSAISYFHQDMILEMDYKSFFELSSHIKLLKQNSVWTDWERYSNRQNERIKLGGITGQALYSGDFKLFSNWLTIAEWIHVGKNPVFGLGKIKVV